MCSSSSGPLQDTWEFDGSADYLAVPRTALFWAQTSDVEL